MTPEAIQAAQAVVKPKRGVAVNSQPLAVANVPDALLKMPTVATIAGLSESSLYRKAATDPTFPKLIRMGKRCTRIRAGDLTAWLAAQAGA